MVSILSVILFIAIPYALVLGPLVWFLVRAFSKLLESPEASQVLEGVAAGSIIAVLTSPLLTRGVGAQGGVLVWLGFVCCCGLSMWLPTPLRPLHLFLASSVPALVLLGAALAIYAIPGYLGYFSCSVISASPGMTCPDPPHAMGLILFVALVSIPGTAAGPFARTRLVAFVKFVAGIDPKQVSRIEKVVNAVVRLVITVSGLFIVLK